MLHRVTYVERRKKKKKRKNWKETGKKRKERMGQENIKMKRRDIRDRQLRREETETEIEAV